MTCTISFSPVPNFHSFPCSYAITPAKHSSSAKQPLIPLSQCFLAFIEVYSQTVMRRWLGMWEHANRSYNWPFLHKTLKFGRSNHIIILSHVHTCTGPAKKSLMQHHFASNQTVLLAITVVLLLEIVVPIYFVQGWHTCASLYAIRILYVHVHAKSLCIHIFYVHVWMFPDSPPCTIEGGDLCSFDK